MKKLIAFISLVLCVCLLTACAGTPVIYQSNCNCSDQNNGSGSGNNNSGSNTGNNGNTGNNTGAAPNGGLKTGIAIVSNIKDSTSATSEKNGVGKYDITMVAVLIDNNGIIKDCIIDGIAAEVSFNSAGEVTTPLDTEIKTKNELGDEYGMVAWGGAIAEWYEQAAALATFARGKTVSELRNGAVDASGKAPENSDLISSATIYLGGYVSAIEAAVANATYLGAQSNDLLRMASSSSISGSTNASDKKGYTQLEVTTTVLTMRSGVITSCVIDAVQAKVEFDSTGTVTSNLKDTIKTKNQLGKDYGMVAWGGAIAEWNEQAASFASYVTGKTPAQVSGIAVNEQTKPTGSDLTSSVTIAIGGFQAIIAKAAK